jgi:EpsI family protein
MTGIMGSKSFVILSGVLLAQAGLFYGFSRKENIPDRLPLAEFRLAGTTWKSVQDIDIPDDEKDVLKADDLLSRVYQDQSSGRIATLFVAFFDTQRTGKAPHSPKNCLPGAGWAPSRSEIVEIPVPDQTQPIQANRYIVARGDNQSVVLYWYQSHNRTVASEYLAKYYTVTDAIRYNRSDTALVRVVVGVSGGDTEKAIKTATDFAVSFFPQLKQQLPTEKIPAIVVRP